MDKNKLKKIVSELEGASKMHASQADRISSMLKFGKPGPFKLKSSGKVSWKYGEETYEGTLIPSMETETHRFARTHNKKIKKLPK
jgi:hypothetical protein|tara:strand:- start:287 stop:541 length:255 start_codon:yes stop_codon:yes gene_type:complete